MNEAKEIFKTEGDYIILDVRTAEEYADGPISGAINVANESIGTDEIEELPDKDQTIYVYCRSGNRSKQAAEKLVKLGNIIWFVFGRILSGLAWIVYGCLWCITIIGIPIGLQCFKFAGLAFSPFGMQYFKLAKLSLMPFGAEVTSL